MIDDIIRLSIGQKFSQRQDGALDQVAYVIAFSEMAGLNEISSTIKTIINVDDKTIQKEYSYLRENSKSLNLIRSISRLTDLRTEHINNTPSIADIRRYSNALGCYDAADLFRGHTN